MVKYVLGKYFGSDSQKSVIFDLGWCLGDLNRGTFSLCAVHGVIDDQNDVVTNTFESSGKFVADISRSQLSFCLAVCGGLTSVLQQSSVCYPARPGWFLANSRLWQLLGRINHIMKDFSTN